MTGSATFSANDIGGTNGTATLNGTLSASGSGSVTITDGVVETVTVTADATGDNQVVANVNDTVDFTSGAFTNITTAAGLSGISQEYGVGWGDYNNDGYSDLYISLANALYKNDGDGTFSAGPALTGGSRGAHWH